MRVALIDVVISKEGEQAVGPVAGISGTTRVSASRRSPLPLKVRHHDLLVHSFRH